MMVVNSVSDFLYKAGNYVYDGVASVALQAVLPAPGEYQTSMADGVQYRVIQPEQEPSVDRVALFCGGFFDRIEMEDECITSVANVLRAPTYIFNYPGIGKSQGQYLNLEQIKKTFQTMLKQVEKENAGKKITCIGNSMGGVVLAGIDGLDLLEDTKVEYVLDRAPDSICSIANQKVSYLGDLLKKVGFDLDSFQIMKDKGITPTVVQSADITEAKVLTDGDSILEDDDFLPKLSTFAYRVFQENLNWTVIGDPSRHFDPSKAFGLVK